MASTILSLAELRERTAHDIERLASELNEIELLAQQARAEAGRYETKRAAAAERVNGLSGRIGSVETPEVLDLAGQLLTLTRKAGLMEAQVEVLEGKAKVLGRYRDGLRDVSASLAVVAESLPASSQETDGTGAAATDGVAGLPGDDVRAPQAVSRIVLSAQEDLRREIARAMHDGPAQSLTNIVLQAQIVERLVTRDPEQAHGEIRQLVAMVQSTLDATKSFIFDVRPMVLDDLGLVPTLRRAARERGRRAHVPVELDSLGQDRRLAMEVEGGLFRIIDETLGAFLAGGPDRVTIRLDWGDQLESLITAERASAAANPAEPWVPLAPPAWQEIQGRAGTLGIGAELLAEGSQVRLVVDQVAAREAD